MANTIIHKKSSVSGKTPLTSDLSLGELAINTYDGKIYLKKNNGTESIVEILPITKSNIENVLTGNISSLGANIGSSTSTSYINISSFAIATYGSAKYIIQGTRGVDRQITELLITHDGVTAYATEYASILTNDKIFNVEVVLSSGNVYVQVANTSTTNTYYKCSQILIVS